MNESAKSIPDQRPSVNFSKRQLDRFWSKVEKTNNCWTWKGSKDRWGYGKAFYNSRDTKAHRMSFEIHNGKIKSGLSICHRCDNPACVNPNHLFEATHAENMRDMAEKGRSIKGRKYQGIHAVGTTVGTAKLSEDKVVEIRKMYVRGKISQATVASRFGIDQTTVSVIILNKNWTHIGG